MLFSLQDAPFSSLYCGQMVCSTLLDTCASDQDRDVKVSDLFVKDKLRGRKGKEKEEGSS